MDEYNPIDEEAAAVAALVPRPVSRGTKLQRGFLGIDSLYVVLEYPYSDVFKFWSEIVGSVPEQQLRDGVPFEEFLIHHGANGYKVSVWDGDARLFLTDNVNENLAGTSREGQGMGLMLQLGPKWLRVWGDSSFPKLIESVFAQFAVFNVRNAADYPARLNRIDLTLDVLGLSVSDFSLDDWRKRWVGYAQQKDFHDAPVTGALSGLSIGSSEGAVRFKVYDKVRESNKRGTSRFWRSVWGIAEDEELAVARFEWSVRPYSAKFKNLRYLPQLSEISFMELLNYVSLKWGRLSLPQENDSNKSRWPLDPLWSEIRAMIEAWTFGHQGVAERTYDFRPDLSRSYVSSFAGWCGGFMARLGIEYRQDEPTGIGDVINYLYEEGFSLLEKAQGKWSVFSRRHGKER